MFVVVVVVVVFFFFRSLRKMIQGGPSRGAGEIRVAKNEGEAARFGGGGEVVLFWSILYIFFFFSFSRRLGTSKTRSSDPLMNWTICSIKFSNKDSYILIFYRSDLEQVVALQWSEDFRMQIWPRQPLDCRVPPIASFSHQSDILSPPNILPLPTW